MITLVPRGSTAHSASCELELVASGVIIGRVNSFVGRGARIAWAGIAGPSKGGGEGCDIEKEGNSERPSIQGRSHNLSNPMKKKTG